MPEEPEERTPRQLVKDIESRSKQFNVLATALSARIIAFENWLNDLPGKVEAYAWYTFGQPDDEYENTDGFCLRFVRDGKRWILSYGYGDMQDETPLDWKPLTEANLESKILGVKQFPYLLEKMKETQDRRVTEIEKTRDDFDDFAKALGIVAEGN